MTAHFSRQEPWAPWDVSAGNAHQAQLWLAAHALASVLREEPRVWKLDIVFHVFGLAQYFHKREKFHSAATKSNHDYRYGICTLGGNAGEQRTNLDITWAETFQSKVKLLMVHRVQKFPPSDDRKPNTIDSWREEERARLFTLEQGEMKGNGIPITSLIIPKWHDCSGHWGF